MDWDDFPVILGQGSLHDLRDADEQSPRLRNMRSVSRAAAQALARKPPAQERRPAGFIRPK